MNQPFSLVSLFGPSPGFGKNLLTMCLKGVEIIKNAKIDYWSEVGKGHLKVKISNANYGNIDGIAFGSKGTPLGDIIMNHSGSLIHFAGVLKKNDWHGNKACDCFPATKNGKNNDRKI